MISYNKALKILKKNRFDIKNEKISLKNSLNRIVAKNIFSPTNYPSANNTAFDGFAINSKETKNINKKKPKKFKIIKILAAGDNPQIKKIPKYSTIEVMTGAIIQKPFDTIIPIEKIKYHPSKKYPKYIIINEKISKNNHIRFEGSDYKKGDKIMSKGQIIEPKQMLSLKTVGIKKLLVKQKPKIVFYSTGNELSSSNKIPFWKVRDSNSIYLKSFLENFPVKFIEKKILRDKDQAKFKKEVENNLKSKTNIIVTSGGVSVGKFDFVPKIIYNYKLKKYFKNVAIRPGKPIMFARFKSNTVFFGLPGNPISSAACFRFFLIPLLFSSIGIKEDRPIFAKIKNSFIKKKDFTRFIKGKISFSKKGNVEFEILKGQESYKINPFSKSNVWGFLPAGIKIFKKGTFIQCYSSTGINELFVN